MNSNSENISKIVNEVKTRGFYVFENFWSQESCDEVIRDIDEVINSYQNAVSKTSSDNRIFGIEYFSNSIKRNFYENKFLLELLKSLYKSNILAGTILGQHVVAEPNNQGSAGTWHRDSIFPQYKAFLFLSDVDEDSGPLQILKKAI